MKQNTKTHKSDVSQEENQQQVLQLCQRMKELEVLAARVQKYLENARTALPAATLNLDILSVKHLRCEEFTLTDRDTGSVRLEIGTVQGTATLAMWPQDGDGSSVVKLSATDEGGHISLQTPDRKNSSSFSPVGYLSIEEERPKRGKR